MSFLSIILSFFCPSLPGYKSGNLFLTFCLMGGSYPSSWGQSHTCLGQEKILSALGMLHALEIVHSFAVNIKKIYVLNGRLQILSLGFLVADPWLECNSSRKELEQGKDVLWFLQHNEWRGESSKANFLLQCQNPMSLSSDHFFFLSFLSLPPAWIVTCVYLIYQWSSLWSPTICAFFFLKCIKP